jgi:Mrp family chromosome partitioning ATPase/DUF971 family protein
MVTVEQVLQALAVIEDPDFRRDIVSLGFVKDVRVAEGEVSLAIELTTPACPVKNEFKRAAEEILLGLPGVKKASVEMRSRVSTLKQQQKESGLAGVKNILAVASCKGGVGKSTVAANLARELSGRGFHVGLLDTDIFGPSVPTLFRLHNPPITQHPNGWIEPVEHDGLKLMSFGFLFPDQPMVMRGPMVSGYIQQILHTVAWGELDYLVLDLPPGTGDIQLTITQSVKLSGAVIVTTPQSLALADVARGIRMFEAVSVPMLGVVENMAYFMCDQCGTKHHLFGDGKGTDLEKRFGLPTLAELPIEKRITEGLASYQPHPAVVAMTDQVAMALGKRLAGGGETPKAFAEGLYVRVEWPGGKPVNLPSRDLRAACQCASCVDEYSGRPILDVSKIPGDIRALSVEPVGNYAVAIHWSDGHDAGIYSWKMLEKLAGK